jgi:hypothetical protein
MPSIGRGYPDQWLDLKIKPLFPKQHLAGVAVTVRAGRDPRLPGETQPNDSSFTSLGELLFPGAVAVVNCGDEPYDIRGRL